MKTKTFAGALAGSFLMSTALTPARGADVTNERLLNPQREPQNWILHHGNYQGHRYSLLNEINTGTVGNLRLAYTVALSGLQPGGRFAHGHRRPQGRLQVEDGSRHRPCLGRRRGVLRHRQPWRGVVEGQSDLDCP